MVGSEGFMANKVNYLERSLYFEHLYDKEVKVVFTDGKLLIGNLTNVGQYEMLLEREGKVLTIFKGAVKYIYLND